MHSRWSLYILTLRGITSQSFLFKTASVIFFPPGVIFLKFNSEDGWTRLTLSEAPHYPQVDWFVQSSNFMIIRIKRKHPCVKQYTCWESSKYEIWSPKGQFISLASPSSSSPTTNTHKYAHVRSNSQLLAEIYVLFETPGPSSGFSLCFKTFSPPTPLGFQFTCQVFNLLWKPCFYCTSWVSWPALDPGSSEVELHMLCMYMCAYVFVCILNCAWCEMRVNDWLLKLESLSWEKIDLHQTT